jgi:hypothetical protein
LLTTTMRTVNASTPPALLAKCFYEDTINATERRSRDDFGKVCVSIKSGVQATAHASGAAPTQQSHSRNQSTRRCAVVVFTVGIIVIVIVVVVVVVVVVGVVVVVVIITTCCRCSRSWAA